MEAASPSCYLRRQHRRFCEFSYPSVRSRERRAHRGVASSAATLGALNVEQAYVMLRSNPRFQDVVRRVGILP